MPPRPHRRKPSKRKKKPKPDQNSTPHGESDGGQHKSPQPLVKVESMDSMEDILSGNESLTTEKTQKTGIEDKAISTKKHEKRRDSRDSKKAAMVEPATVADYLSQPFESSPEKGSLKVNDLGFMTPPSLDPVDPYLSQPFESSPEKGSPKVNELGFMTPPSLDPVDPVDQSLVEVACEVLNYTKIQEKEDLDQTVIIETDPKENPVQKLGSLSNKASPKSRNNLLQDSTNDKCRYCGRRGDDRVNEPEMLELSDRQPLIASDPESSKKTSWKNCCGIFELFSGSSRS